MRVAYTVPRQVVLVTASDGAERALWPVDWHMPLGFEPPRYVLAVSRAGHGTGVLRRAGCFVVNVVPASWESTILAAGQASGANGDKLAALGLLTEQALFVAAPYLCDALGRLECSVEEISDWGDRVLVVARVLHAEEADSSEPRLHHLWRAR